MDRSAKQELVAALNANLQAAGLVVVTRQTGLTVAEATKLRVEMRAAGARFKITKNRLARLALQGTAYEHLTSQLTGPTALAYSADPVAAAKVVVAFAKTNDKLTIVSGSLAGVMLDIAGVSALAMLPSLDALRGTLIGLLQAPATKVAGVLAAPAGQVARVFAAYARAEESMAA